MHDLCVDGKAAGLLRGNLREDVQAPLVGRRARWSDKCRLQRPAHTPGECIFVPPVAMGWLTDYALRERAEPAEAAEVHATRDAAGDVVDAPCLNLRQA